MDRELGIKAIGAMEFADDEKGEVKAVVYTLGMVDKDREVVLPPGFQGEARVKLSHYGHSTVLAQARGAAVPVEAPVGKGVVSVNRNNEVEFRGKYFMSTERGREAYFTAKEMGPEQEWSFTFWRDSGKKPTAEWSAKGARRMWDTSIDPFEVSPVAVASSIGTRTVGVKCEGCGVEHEGDSCEQCSAKAAELAETKAAEEKAVAAKSAEEEEAARLEAEQKAAKLRAEIDEEVERFQRTRRLFNL